MTNKEEQIEKIAQEEVYPSRYFGRKFPGSWPSKRHQEICVGIAEDTYLMREAQARREAREEKKRKDDVAKRERTSSEESEQQGD